MSKNLKQTALVILDVIFINVSMFVAYFIKFHWLIPPVLLNIHAKSFIPITIIMLASFYLFKLYRSIWKYASIDELVSVILAITVGAVSNQEMGSAALHPFLGKTPGDNLSEN